VFGCAKTVTPPEAVSETAAAPSAAAESADLEGPAAFQAWGDAGAGVFAIAAELSAIGKPDPALHRALRDGLSEAGFEVAQWQLSDDGRRSRLNLSRGALSGSVRAAAAAADGQDRVRAEALVCIHNQREPDSSAALCAELLARFEDSR
ncbi:MAG: hypothetical protein AAGC55_15875, partial [Myxococcota bacterium]